MSSCRTPRQTTLVLALALFASACTSGGANDGPSGSASGVQPSGSLASSATAGSTGARPTASRGSLSVIPSRAQSTRPPVAITATASFGQGLSASLVRYESAKVLDSGPGALTGRAATAFTIEFRNRSTTPVSLDSVQVSAMYGKNLSASPVNQNRGAARGKLAANATGRGTYTFAIPTAELKKVEVAVAIDPRRPTVVFVGPVR